MNYRSEDLNKKEMPNMQGGTGIVERFNAIPYTDAPLKRMSRLVFKPGVTVGMHSHKNEIEIFYVIDGEIIVNVEGEEDAILKKGDTHVYDYTDERKHSVRNDGSETAEYLAITIKSEL